MDKKYADKYLASEVSKWWFSGRRNMILRLVKQFPKSSKILDIGCSGGALLTDLKGNGFSDLKGIDISSDAVACCAEKGFKAPHVVVADASSIPFESGSFDLAIASDVLEHIKDEGKALNEWLRILKPGGLALIFVPAFDFLKSEHDTINHHFRRYSRTYLKKAVERSGFKVVRASYWNILLFIPAFVLRVLFSRINKESRAPQSHVFGAGPVANRILDGILKAENSILSLGINFPFGVSVFCIARKGQ